MPKPKRSPVQVSDNFLNKLKELQRKIRMKTGDEVSLRELTEDLAINPLFNDIEKKILEGDLDELNMNIDVRFDRRRK